MDNLPIYRITIHSVINKMKDEIKFPLLEPKQFRKDQGDEYIDYVSQWARYHSARYGRIRFNDL